MPREQVNTPARRIVTMPTATNGLKPDEFGVHFTDYPVALGDGQHMEDTAALAVGWAKPNELPGDGLVQLQMRVSESEVLRAAALIERKREQMIGEPFYEFSTIAITRTEANKAIRAIRRARDAAFEADE